jgi:hypothetical protein
MQKILEKECVHGAPFSTKTSLCLSGTPCTTTTFSLGAIHFFAHSFVLLTEQNNNGIVYYIITIQYALDCAHSVFAVHRGGLGFEQRE